MSNQDIEFDKIKKDLEKRLSKKLSRYYFKDNELLHRVALTVYAGFIFIKDKELSSIYEKQRIINKEIDIIINELKAFYSDKSLSDIIKVMICKQAEVNYLRRIIDGKYKGHSDHEYNKDRWEAIRYIAFLFCEEILNRCIKDGACPDFSVNIFNNEIIELLKSLSVEEYCRIKGHLAFLDRNSEEGNGQHIHGFDQIDFLDAMGNLDFSFKNCSKRKRKRLHPVVSSILISKNKEAIKQAKYNPKDRIGDINQEAINDFVNNFYSLIEKIEHCDKKEAKQVISDLYNRENTKFINMAEFMLKCMIASYIDEDDYKDARSKAGKKTIKKKHSPDKLIDPIFC